ncbi:MAG TPA: ABC transporter ATP-binding protein [Stellaceae bacterium]|jgi:ABC-type branched-subunit amino acid transport system ATPase component|nr:ABC transporter ATP-binding protein [Stellaceae bacterium]
MPPLLTVEDVYAGYQSGVDILQGLSLRVAPAGLTLVIGPNGAGKSTLLKTAFGFLHPHQGRIRFAETEIAGAAPHAVKRLGISYVPQEINIFPLLTVEENLRMGGWVFRRDRTRLKARIEAIYGIFPALAEGRRQPAGNLSGGQGRMLSVARELMTEPKLLLVDEPTAGLSPALVEQVYALLRTAREAIGATILLVDQNVEAALGQADSVYLLNLGRVKAEGPAAAFPPARVRDLIRECLLG